MSPKFYVPRTVSGAEMESVLFRVSYQGKFRSQSLFLVVAATTKALMCLLREPQTLYRPGMTAKSHPLELLEEAAQSSIIWLQVSHSFIYMTSTFDRSSEQQSLSLAYFIANGQAQEKPLR